jgi:hypothetical protein
VQSLRLEASAEKDALEKRLAGLTEKALTRLYKINPLPPAPVHRKPAEIKRHARVIQLQWSRRASRGAIAPPSGGEAGLAAMPRGAI